MILHSIKLPVDSTWLDFSRSYLDGIQPFSMNSRQSWTFARSFSIGDYWSKK